MASSGDLSVTLANLERERITSLAKAQKWLAVTLLVTGGLAVYCYASDSMIAMAVAIVVGLLVGFGGRSYLLNKVVVAFKNEVMPFLVADIDPSLVYRRDKYIEQAVFERSGLYSRPDRYSGKDGVSGYIGGTEVQFSMVDAEEEREVTTTDSDGHSHTERTYHTLFRGLFFVADFNKHFAGRTLVRHGAAGYISKLFGSYVTLEDIEFNKLFRVTSTDQVEARYILTPSLMERLRRMQEKFGAFQISFNAGRVYMAVELPFDSFEPNVGRSFTDNSQVQEILLALKSVTGVVEDMGLNTRIWSKPDGRPATVAMTGAADINLA